MWNAVVSVGLKMVVLLVGWVGKCFSELGTLRRRLDQAKLEFEMVDL